MWTLSKINYYCAVKKQVNLNLFLLIRKRIICYHFYRVQSSISFIEYYKVVKILFNKYLTQKNYKTISFTWTKIFIMFITTKTITIVPDILNHFCNTVVSSLARLEFIVRLHNCRFDIKLLERMVNGIITVVVTVFTQQIICYISLRITLFTPFLWSRNSSISSSFFLGAHNKISVSVY